MKTSIINYALIFATILNTSCENRSDKREYKKTLAASVLQIKNVVPANVQTTPVAQAINDDAADDPAIWVHPTDPKKSVVYGTDKKGGLAVYNMQGAQLAYYPIGRTNNVDVRQNVVWGNDTIDIMATTNRDKQAISVAKILPNGLLVFFEQAELKSRVNDEVYGFCLYHSRKTGKLYAFLNTKEGECEQWELMPDAKTGIKGKIVRDYNIGVITEGLVANDATAKIYQGYEELGIYVFDAEPHQAHKPQRIKNSGPSDNAMIKADVEGLSIYYTSDTTGYLIASSQGNFSYAVFALEGNNKYLFSFRIGDGESIDGVQETDGLDIYSGYINEQFPKGILMVQDGFNFDTEDKKQPQNFKFVDWQQIEKFIK